MKAGKISAVIAVPKWTVNERTVTRMPEYIDREKLLEDIEHTVIFTVCKSELAYGESRGAIKVINRIEAAPSADVVEVVRCKDCAHYGGITFGKICRRWSAFNTKNCTKPDDFCSYGIKKDW